MPTYSYKTFLIGRCELCRSCISVPLEVAANRNIPLCVHKRTKYSGDPEISFKIEWIILQRFDEGEEERLVPNFVIGEKHARHTNG
jgi:hypothetical protein